MLIVAEIDLTTVKVLLDHNNRKKDLCSFRLAPEHKRKAVTMFNFLLKSSLSLHTTSK